MKWENNKSVISFRNIKYTLPYENSMHEHWSRHLSLSSWVCNRFCNSSRSGNFTYYSKYIKLLKQKDSFPDCELKPINFREIKPKGSEQDA